MGNNPLINDLILPMWKNGAEYHDQGADHYEQRYKHWRLPNLKKKARALGYNINLEPIRKDEVLQAIIGVVSYEKVFALDSGLLMGDNSFHLKLHYPVSGPTKSKHSRFGLNPNATA